MVWWLLLGGAVLWWLVSSPRLGPESTRRPTPEEASRAAASYGERRLAISTDVVGVLQAYGDQSVPIADIKVDTMALRADADVLDYVYDLPRVAGMLRRLAAMKDAETSPYESLVDAADKAFSGVKTDWV